MRFNRVGIVLLLLMWPLLARAQPAGDVESIGFGNAFRPDAWTPMLVRLRPDSLDNKRYSIRILQEDLDEDVAIYESPLFTLQGNEEGRAARTDRFWVYFLPRPIKGGLPDRNDPNRSALKDLQQSLTVQLVDENGTPVAPLAIGSTLVSADPPRESGFPTARSRRFVLMVSDGSSQAPALSWNPIGGGGRAVVGNVEDTLVVQVQPRDLPENVLGFDAVDTIVWLNADANELTGGTRARALEALDQWVRRGGRLVVCQGGETQRVEPFASLLPIETTGPQGGWSIPMVETRDLTPLRELAMKGVPVSGNEVMFNQALRDWRRPTTAPFKMALVEPRRGAVVDQWMPTPPDAGAVTVDPSQTQWPFIVRQTVGLGTVTWVATDLGSRTLTSGLRKGWPAVWDAVLGLNANATVDLDELVAPTDPNAIERTNRPVPRPAESTVSSLMRSRFTPAPAVDLGAALRPFTDLGARSSKLIAVAVVFFVVYWVVAGPGIFFYLLAKKQAYKSWFVFGLSAIAATVITVVVVQVVVSGAPQVSHVSVMRFSPGEPADVISRMGLFIPRDGAQTISLGAPAPGRTSFVVPLTEHSDFSRNSVGFVDHLEYTVPLPEAGSAHEVEIPFRRTLKKLQARWTGDTGGSGIVGNVRAVQTGALVEGKLSNATGRDLKQVYFAFTQRAGGQPVDWMLYLPEWKNNTSIDLAVEMNSAPLLNPDGGAQPGRGNKVKAPLVRGQGWTRYWHPQFRMRGGMGTDTQVNDLTSASGVPSSFIMLSLFGLLNPAANATDQTDRYELIRRGARDFDLSSVVAAGDMLVVAQGAQQESLPIPLEVNGRKPEGNGLLLFQFVVPVLRDTELDPATQPAGDNNNDQAALTNK